MYTILHFLLGIIQHNLVAFHAVGFLPFMGTIGSGNTIVASDFVGSSSGAGDSGKVIKLNASGNVAKGFINASFGGTGTDGALTISSGTTTINCASAAIVTKNYTSISITGTGKLAFSNPNASGTIIILKSTGNVTLTSSTAPMIDCSSMGAGTGGNAANGNFGNALTGRVDNGKTGSSSTGGGGGGASVVNSASSGSGSGNGAGGNALYAVAPTVLTKVLCLGCGSAGGGGQALAGGGLGGGALLIECAGALNFTTASGISVNGAAGGTSSGGSSNAGGGGGGSCIIIYNALTSASGTITVAGGAAGTGGGGGAAAAGANGYSLVAANTEFP